MIGIAITRDRIRHSSAGRAEQREHEDRDDHHDDQEVRAAPDVLLRDTGRSPRARAPRRARTRRSSCARRRGTRTPGGCPSSGRSARGRPTKIATRKTPSPTSVRMPSLPVRFSNHANRVVGPMMKMPTNSTSASTTDRTTWRGVSRSSSSSDWLADDHQRAHADRERLAEHDDPAEERLAEQRVRAARSSRSRATRRGSSPSGLRTAIAQKPAPRIITPSTTAWPP